MLFWHLAGIYRSSRFSFLDPHPSLCSIHMLSLTFPSFPSALHLCAHPSLSLESFSGPHLSFSGQPGSCLLLVSPDHSQTGRLLILHLEFGSRGFIVQHGACDSATLLPRCQAAHDGGCILAVPGATECLCGLKEALGLVPWKKSYDQLSILKSRDITLPTKVLVVNQSYGFSSSHVWM